MGPLDSFPLLEDMTLCRRLSRLGQVISVDREVSVSARRSCRMGIPATVGTNLWLTMRCLAGAPPEVLFDAYYGEEHRGHDIIPCPPDESTAPRID